MTQPAANPDPADLSSLTFSHAAPLPDDAPDFTASADFDHGANATPVDPTPPRRRLLPGRGAGTRDNASNRARDKATKTPKVDKPLPPIPTKGFAPGVEKMYETLATMVLPFDVELANTLTKVAPEAAVAWDELARQNHAVRRFLVWLTETTAWGALAQAHAPIFALALARLLGNSQRQTLAAMFLGAEAERFANNGDGGNGPAPQ